MNKYIVICRESIAFYKNCCYSLSEQRRSWSFGSRLEFPNESRFALPNRLVELKNKEPYKRCGNAPDSYIRSFFCKDRRDCYGRFITKI